MDYSKTAEFMKSLRKAKGYTQEEVAEQLMVTPKTVSRWECGEGLPDIAIISAVADLYGVTVDELLKGEKNNEFKESKNSEATIKSKNRSKGKLYLHMVEKKFKPYLISALISLAVLWLAGVILLTFPVDKNLSLPGLICLIVSYIISFVLILIGNQGFKNLLNDNEDEIDEDLLSKMKERIYNLRFFYIDLLVGLTILLFLFFLIIMTVANIAYYVFLIPVLDVLFCYGLIRRHSRQKPEQRKNTKVQLLKTMFLSQIPLLAFCSVVFQFDVTYPSQTGNGTFGIVCGFSPICIFFENFASTWFLLVPGLLLSIGAVVLMVLFQKKKMALPFQFISMGVGILGSVATALTIYLPNFGGSSSGMIPAPALPVCVLIVLITFIMIQKLAKGEKKDNAA